MLSLLISRHAVLSIQIDSSTKIKAPSYPAGVSLIMMQNAAKMLQDRGPLLRFPVLISDLAFIISLTSFTAI